MTRAALTGLAAALFNVAASQLAARLPGKMSTRYGVVQAAMFFMRGAVLFGAATWWWRRTYEAKEVVVLIFIGAVTQLVGQSVLQLREDRCSISQN